MSQPIAQIKVLSQEAGDVLEKAEKKFGDKRQFFVDFHICFAKIKNIQVLFGA